MDEKVKNMLIVLHKETEQVEVRCNFLNDPLICYGMLQCAQEAIFIYNHQPGKEAAQPVVGDLNAVNRKQPKIPFYRKLFKKR